MPSGSFFLSFVPFLLFLFRLLESQSSTDVVRTTQIFSVEQTPHWPANTWLSPARGLPSYASPPDSRMAGKLGPFAGA